jgi:hypothetical protein
VVELTECTSCSAPISPGQALCLRCGAVLPVVDPAAAEASATEDPRIAAFRRALATEPVADPVEIDAGASDGQDPAAPGRPSESESPQRWTAATAAARAATAREAAAKAVAQVLAHAAATSASGDEDAADPEVEPDNAIKPETTVEPVAEPGAATSDRYLAPSASRSLGAIGAARPAPAPLGSTSPMAGAPATPYSAPVQAPPAASVAVPALAQAPEARPLAGGGGPVVAPPVSPARPVVPMTTSERIKVTLASMAAEPKSELAATCLTALGGALALVGFALPWTAENGLGVGTVDIHPRPGAWAFDTAAGWPLFLIAALLLASILASDQLEELMPGLAVTIRRLTEVAVPMLLGAILLGVSLLYVTLPWGFGGGIVLVTLGATLLIAGSIVGLFFPAGERKN